MKLLEQNKLAINRFLEDLWAELESPGTLEELTIRLMERYDLNVNVESPS